jgi:small subunit ribosomal protein S6
VNEYELTVLYHPDLEIDIDKALAKVEKILKDNGATVAKLDNWGKRKLAYPIKKQDHALYVYYEIAMPGENITKVEGILNITDEVLRYLIVKPGPEIEEDEKSDDSESDEEEKEESKENDEEA